MRKVAVLLMLVLGMTLALAGACSGSDEDGAPVVSILDGDDEQATGAPSATPDEGGSDSDDDSDGEGEGSGDVPSDFDACSLLTADEIAGVIGVAVDEGERFESPPNYDCQWLGDAGGIDVLVFTGERDDVRSYFEIGHEDDDEVDGVGEGAYWNDALQDLEVLAGNYSVSVSAAGTGDLTLDEAKDLAQRAIGNLP